ncbi:MAG: hypothetical protein A3D24_04110 [Candidatus Blackburnbacteria bacterium RIFCSPHIGHO2_02_FULL_39_13]|uniref:asparagine synthase (glutamine-hydrolyzing) n=1 Tax=Candidatus Blackburnbacteria bacterium RIFCSPLOWO2_01_FULL_40_20 TaxID=1797519 RepID=A0A1G1VAR0_9BACT|nr:MAG: hypothetical protein A2694_02685 [Candidatus Blackburnbacteria bacterium RIFCSPHIGHO2_01_FULL_40_17]OGY08415.1 MAG: hypothetical protein A3D24_04110 [Candidatus Blackburnbacteria bacterium RIFCSPHIGHO2_02_FULL_39_13]OGY12489.1 MAG: hypothetical protein A3A77_00750 [Candidatus Blackburnbacteria bacterium RIFCSPLOWO2_01_FULL_40_20]HBL52129.1 hypothetical protein [Candidatus Blackburnbacteria bacterium]
MKKLSHLYLEIPKKLLKDGLLSEIVAKGFVLPERTFPPSFHLTGKGFFCAGYFVCYNKKVTFEEIVELCKEGGWDLLGNLVGDFLIIYCDFAKNEIFLLTDQTGKFPCFFSVEDDKFVLSTDFETVKDKLSSLTLNIGAAFGLISRQILVSDQTVVAEINQVPPATLLKIKNDFSYSLTPLVDLDKFLEQRQQPYASAEKFSNDFLLSLKRTIAERLSSIEHLPFAGDISSGFDSSLVVYLLKKQTKKSFKCYCGISKYTLGDTHPKIVEELAQKYGLIIKYINEDPFYPFASKNDLKRAAKIPNQIAEGLLFHFYSYPAKEGIKIEFTGEGGDEIYKAHAMDVLSPFPVQEEYFWTVKKLKFGLDKIFTDKGIQALLDKERFQRKKIFPSIISPSAILVNSGLFPVYWETGIWPMTPFIDPRLVQLARMIPRKGSKALSKQEIWKTREEIFAPSQFRPKEGPVGHVQLFLDKKQDFIISVLKKSILAQKGWIKASEIIDDMKKGDTHKYLEGDALSFLLATLQLEYFIQQNNIKISD